MAISFIFKPAPRHFISLADRRKFVDVILNLLDSWAPCDECPWTQKTDIEYDTHGPNSVKINLPFLSFRDGFRHVPGEAMQKILNSARITNFFLFRVVSTLEVNTTFLGTESGEAGGYFYPLSYFRGLDEKEQVSRIPMPFLPATSPASAAPLPPIAQLCTHSGPIFLAQPATSIEFKQRAASSKQEIEACLSSLIERQNQQGKPIVWEMVSDEKEQPCVQMNLIIRKEHTDWFRKKLHAFKISFMPTSQETHVRLKIHNVNIETFIVRAEPCGPPFGAKAR